MEDPPPSPSPSDEVTGKRKSLDGRKRTRKKKKPFADELCTKLENEDDDNYEVLPSYGIAVNRTSKDCIGKDFGGIKYASWRRNMLGVGFKPSSRMEVERFDEERHNLLSTNQKTTRSKSTEYWYHPDFKGGDFRKILRSKRYTWGKSPTMDNETSSLVEKVKSDGEVMDAAGGKQGSHDIQDNSASRTGQLLGSSGASTIQQHSDSLTLEADPLRDEEVEAMMQVWFSPEFDHESNLEIDKMLLDCSKGDSALDEEIMDRDQTLSSAQKSPQENDAADKGKCTESSSVSHKDFHSDWSHNARKDTDEQMDHHKMIAQDQASSSSASTSTQPNPQDTALLRARRRFRSAVKKLLRDYNQRQCKDQVHSCTRVAIRTFEAFTKQLYHMMEMSEFASALKVSKHPNEACKSSTLEQQKGSHDDNGEACFSIKSFIRDEFETSMPHELKNLSSHEHRNCDEGWNEEDFYGCKHFLRKKLQDLLDLHFVEQKVGNVSSSLAGVASINALAAQLEHAHQITFRGTEPLEQQQQDYRSGGGSGGNQGGGGRGSSGDGGSSGGGGSSRRGASGGRGTGGGEGGKRREGGCGSGDCCDSSSGGSSGSSGNCGGGGGGGGSNNQDSTKHGNNTNLDGGRSNNFNGDCKNHDSKCKHSYDEVKKNSGICKGTATTRIDKSLWPLSPPQETSCKGLVHTILRRKIDDLEKHGSTNDIVDVVLKALLSAVHKIHGHEVSFTKLQDASLLPTVCLSSSLSPLPPVLSSVTSPTIGCSVQMNENEHLKLGDKATSEEKQGTGSYVQTPLLAEKESLCNDAFPNFVPSAKDSSKPVGISGQFGDEQCDLSDFSDEEEKLTSMDSFGNRDQPQLAISSNKKVLTHQLMNFAKKLHQVVDDKNYPNFCWTPGNDGIIVRDWRLIANYGTFSKLMVMCGFERGAPFLAGLSDSSTSATSTSTTQSSSIGSIKMSQPMDQGMDVTVNEIMELTELKLKALLTAISGNEEVNAEDGDGDDFDEMETNPTTSGEGNDEHGELFSVSTVQSNITKDTKMVQTSAWVRPSIVGANDAPSLVGRDIKDSGTIECTNTPVDQIFDDDDLLDIFGVEEQDMPDDSFVEEESPESQTALVAAAGSDTVSGQNFKGMNSKLQSTQKPSQRHGTFIPSLYHFISTSKFAGWTTDGVGFELKGPLNAVAKHDPTFCFTSAMSLLRQLNVYSFVQPQRGHPCWRHALGQNLRDLGAQKQWHLFPRRV